MTQKLYDWEKKITYEVIKEDLNNLTMLVKVLEKHVNFLLEELKNKK